MNRSLRTSSLLLLAVASLSRSATAQMSGDGSKALEWRRHFTAVDKASGVSYSLTEMTALPSEGEDRVTILLQDDVTSDRLIFKDATNFFDQESILEVSDPETKDTITVKHPLPYHSITRHGAIEEVKKNPALRNQPITSLSVNVNGVQFVASEGEWMSPVQRDKVSAMRRAASPQFLEKIERLRVVFAGNHPLSIFCHGMLRYLLYNETCTRPGAEVKPAPPDCAYDASFKFDCSQKQKDKIAKSLLETRHLDTY